MVRSQHLKDTTTQHITTHMHGYKKKKKSISPDHGMHANRRLKLSLQYVFKKLKTSLMMNVFNNQSYFST